MKDSILRDNSRPALMHWSWDLLNSEFRERLPLCMKLLEAISIKPRNERIRAEKKKTPGLPTQSFHKRSLPKRSLPKKRTLPKMAWQKTADQDEDCVDLTLDIEDVA